MQGIARETRQRGFFSGCPPIIRGMSLQGTTLAIQDLDLSAAECAQLAVRLFDSVEESGAKLWPEALELELRRRSAELKSGQVKGLTSEEIFGETL